MTGICILSTITKHKKNDFAYQEIVSESSNLLHKLSFSYFGKASAKMIWGLKQLLINKGCKLKDSEIF